MRINKQIAVFLVMFSCSASADVTGAGDAAIFGELKIHTAKFIENIEKVSAALDISKRMEQMESLKAVKRISAEGQALRGVIEDVTNINGLIDEQKNNLLNHKDVVSQIDSLQYRIDNADNPGAYANLAADLKRVRFLGQANQRAMEKLVKGSNEADDNKSTATATLIMSDILIRREEREAIGASEEIQALQAIIGSNKYSELYGEDE